MKVVEDYRTRNKQRQIFKLDINKARDRVNSKFREIRVSKSMD